MNLMKKIVNFFTRTPFEIEKSTIYELKDNRCEFPCLAQIGNDTLICVFRIADDHFASKSRLVYVLSFNSGETWSEPIEICEEKILAKSASSWNCPSLSRLPNGDVVLCCDENIKSNNLRDESMFQVNLHFWKLHLKGQQIIVSDYWVIDNYEVFGFNQDRILILPDDRWILGWHFYGNRITFEGEKLSANPNLVQCISFSKDQGKTWYGHKVIADKENANICDGNIIFLNNNKLGCFMRDHSFNGAPSYVAFSDDLGKSWTEPFPLPFSGHHNITKKIDNNILFSFYRNVNMVEGKVRDQDLGVWGTFFNINKFSLNISFEIEYDGTMWQNFGWGDTVILNNNKIMCVYYLTGQREYPVIRQAIVSFDSNKLRKKLTSK